MKRYILSLFAVIIAVSMAAFTSPPKTTLVYFTFTGSTANSGEVADESKWVEAEQDANCDGHNQACQIAVDESSVSGMSGSRTLSGNTSVQINSAEGSVSGHYYPTYDSGSSIQVLNKP